ncbi:MAG: LamG-like jellyroll fold domain-containing protein, partial [Paracoccaceae bacterium]
TEILADYGVSGHGHVMRELTHETGTDASEKLSGNVDDDAMFGGAGDDTLSGRSGEDLLQGGTGNDRLFGGAGDDIIDGGEGEDFLRGGAGNDLLISRGDGREPDIAYDPDRDEGDPLNELTNGKLYPNQPVPGGDALVGDKGADIFYFQSLINAKERFIKKHTQDDGTINWHGVAGENDSLHDHWVDSIGHDMIMDYSRAEGDRIAIEGHTTQISDITYGDADGDGVLDHSIISLYSDQGNNGGAHNLDELGTITVYGDLVKLSDIEHTAAPAYGIVATIEDIKDALAPSEVSEDIEHKFVSALTDGGTVTADDGTPPVFAASGSYSFVRDERAALVFDHTNAMSLASGTIALTFQADVLIDHQWLISKDATGNADGHLAVYLNVDGNLTVRLQTADKSHYFTIEEAIETGRSYDFAVTFGDQGLEVYLDGVRAAYDEELQVGLDGNNEALIIGANGWSATPGTTDNINSHFTGEISDVAVYDRQLDADELYGSAPRSNIQYMTGEVESYTVAQNAAGDIILKGEEGRTVVDDAEYIAFDDLSVRTQDIEFGSKNEDTITGSDGADILVGRGGADQLFGYGNDDVLMGRWGDDSLWGSEGNDLLLGDIGDDYLNGGSQSDTLHGGEGDDDLKGGEGDDHLYGGLGDDYLYGESWGEADPSATDIVYYDGNFADYSFSTHSWFHTGRDETVQQLIVEDAASGGLDGFYEGQDRLLDIDLIVFADQTVSVVDLL